MFAVIVTGREARASSGEVVGREGDRYWLIKESEDWVGVTTIRLSSPFLDIEMPNLLTFETREAAERFVRTWEPHPWWVKVKSHEVVEVRPTYKQVVAGYEVVSE